jgi:type IV pilus assembly protein PilX
MSIVGSCCNKAKQQGSVLLAVLVLLFVFTLTILANSRQLLIEQHISSNWVDKQRAQQLAFITLDVAEQRSRQLDRLLAELDTAALYGNAGDGGIFNRDCSNSENPAGFIQGLCLDSGHQPQLQPVEDRSSLKHGKVQAILSPCGNSLEHQVQRAASICRNGNALQGKELWTNPRYVIELIDHHYAREHAPTARLYRITVRAWGNNRNSAVTLQRYVMIQSKATLKLLEPHERDEQEADL